MEEVNAVQIIEILKTNSIPIKVLADDAEIYYAKTIFKTHPPLEDIINKLIGNFVYSSWVIRASIGNRAKESLVVDYINETNLDNIEDKPSILDSFYDYAQRKQKEEVTELITDQSLNEEAAKRYIANSLKREYATDNGTELNSILPKMSPLNPQYLTKKQSVFQKISAFVEKFKGIGGLI